MDGRLITIAGIAPYEAVMLSDGIKDLLGGEKTFASGRLREYLEQLLDPLRRAAFRPERVKTLAEVERDHILAVFGLNDGIKSRTADALGICQKTLYTRLHLYGLMPKEAASCG